MADGAQSRVTVLPLIVVLKVPLVHPELLTVKAVPVTVPEPVLSTTVQLRAVFQNESAAAGDVAEPVKEGTRVAPELIARPPKVPTRIGSKLVPAPEVVRALSSHA